MNFVNIPIDSIQQNENSRVIYKECDLTELMGSMKRDGLLQPVGVRKLGKGYEAVYGNRRILAAKKLGWESIPAVIIKASNDNDRDILNLVENIKRKNTTLAEDGRMFRLLTERGLSVPEVAARLDISVERINTALEVLNVVPTNQHSLLINKQATSLKGKVPVTTTVQILSMRKKHKLNRKQTRELIQRAAEGTTIHQIGQAAQLMGQGTSFGLALKKMERCRFVTLECVMDKNEVEKWEKKNPGLHINKYLIGVLARYSKFAIEPRWNKKVV